MNRTETQEHLAEADEHIEAGEARIAKQEERLKELATDGHKTDQAERLLENLKEMEETMREHRDILRHGLKTSTDQ
jgi:hypothetical protein